MIEVLGCLGASVLRTSPQHYTKNTWVGKAKGKFLVTTWLKNIILHLS